MKLLCLTMSLAVVVFAHHGWAAFDTRAQVTLTGTVLDFHWVNPHSVVDFEVKDEQGKLQKWQGEVTSPNRLEANGWTRTSLEEGMNVTVTGYPAKNGARSVWVTKIVLGNGKSLKIGSDN